jgi:predicted lactoylglutathione lyase
MSTLNTVEIKAFLPAKDFEVSKNFYSDIGFIKASDEGGVAYFYHGQCSFLL